MEWFYFLWSTKQICECCGIEYYEKRIDKSNDDIHHTCSLNCALGLIIKLPASTENLQILHFVEDFPIHYDMDFSSMKRYYYHTPKNVNVTEPIWCKNKMIDKQNLESFYHQRRNKLASLMKFDLSDVRYKVDFDFINHFSNFFFIDNPFIKDTIFNKDNIIVCPENLNQGKTAKGYIIMNLYKQLYVLKIIPFVRLNHYLPIRVFKLDESKIKNSSFEFNSIQIKNKSGKYCIQVPSDNFTNQTIIHMILNLILGKCENYLYQYDVFYFSKPSLYGSSSTWDGYNITEYCNFKDLSYYLNQVELNEDILLDVLSQVMKPLLILKQPIFGFLHSDLKTKNIFVHVENQKTIFKIGDFDKSSIFFNKIRFFNQSYNFTLNGKVDGWNIKSTPFLLYHTDKYDYYTLYDGDYISEYITFHEYLMSNPEGFYASFDIYTFFYSLILEKPVCRWLLEHPDSLVWKFYHFLFHKEEPEEWNKFTKNIVSLLEIPEAETCRIKFYWNQFKINKFKLRYNIDEIYNLLNISIPKIKELFPKETIDKILNTKEEITLKISKNNHIFTHEPFETDKSGMTNVYSKYFKTYLYNYDSI